MNDRRHQLQRHNVQEVTDAIRTEVFGDQNRRIMADLFLHNMTYQATAERHNLSVRGLYNRVDSIYPAVYRKLNKPN